MPGAQPKSLNKTSRLSPSEFDATLRQYSTLVPQGAAVHLAIMATPDATDVCNTLIGHIDVLRPKAAEFKDHGLGIFDRNAGGAVKLALVVRSVDLLAAAEAAPNTSDGAIEHARATVDRHDAARCDAAPDA